MAYVDRAALQQRYGADEVAQRESVLPAGALDTILADAGSMIDGYLSSRYALPLAAVPSQIGAVACAIARYKLLGDAVTEFASNEYRDAVSWLRDVAKGAVILDGAQAVAGNSPATVVMYSPSERVFSRTGRP